MLHVLCVFESETLRYIYHTNELTQGQTCSTFGIHSKMRSIAKLYKDGDAAFVTNIGALLEPVTTATYKKAQKCTGLFSHKDM